MAAVSSEGDSCGQKTATADENVRWVVMAIEPLYDGGNEETFLSVIFPGESEMAGRMRQFNWSTTDLGAPEDWPQNLRTAIALCSHRDSQFLSYGGRGGASFTTTPTFRFLEKHPRYLAQAMRECWAEIWDTIGPMLDEVYTTGKATWSDDVQFFFARKLPREEVYVTFTYGPILSADGRSVEGIFCPCTQTTEEVVGEHMRAELTKESTDRKQLRRKCLPTS